MPEKTLVGKPLVDEDISRASTLPADFYRDESYFQEMKERVFAKSWQFAGASDMLKSPGQAVPWTMLEGYINEPLLLTRDANDNLHCFSNVCTHRGNLLIEGECHADMLRCRYHGRRFALDGKFVSMPGFEGAKDFPTEADNLTPVTMENWSKFLFVSLEPAFLLEELIGEMKARVGFLPLEKFVFDPDSSRDYLVRANWALYCDNYLEGFHIPYVHPSLAQALDTKEYDTEVFKYSNLQTGVAKSPGEAFELPEDSPDYGKLIGGYYFWLYPNMMFNFYPWGLSINIVLPLAADRTKVSFRTYVFDPSKRDAGAGAGLDRVEREDEDIVEKVQLGVQSRFYNRGRFSPTEEKGVHHFHRLLSQAMV